MTKKNIFGDIYVNNFLAKGSASTLSAIGIMSASKERRKMTVTMEQRLKRLEDILLKKKEDEFVTISVPGVPDFRMAKRQERNSEGERITVPTYKDAIERARSKGCRLWKRKELFAMMDYAIEKLGDNWRDVRKVEKLFGIEDLEFSEWLFHHEKVAGIHWSNRATAGPFCATLGASPSLVHSLTGFRCCKDIVSSKD